MAVIKYIGTGRTQPKVKIEFSRNRGTSWQSKELVGGQSFATPPDCTNLLMDKVPYDPKANYEIRDGKISQK